MNRDLLLIHALLSLSFSYIWPVEGSKHPSVKAWLISNKTHPCSAQQPLQTHQHTYTNRPFPAKHTQNTALYLVCGPLYLHRHDEVGVTNRLVAESREEMVGMQLLHMYMYIHIT